VRHFRASLCLTAALLPISGEASADTQASLDVAARASASDNPLLSPESDTGALMGEIRVEPSLVRETPTTSVRLLGSLTQRYYSRLYDSATYGRAELMTAARLSERLSVSGSARHSRSLAADSYEDVDAAIDPRSLRIGTSANLGAQLQVSERSSLTGNAYVERNRFDDTEILRGYDAFGGGVGYMRALSERLGVGAQAQTSFQEYADSSNSRVISFGGTAQYKVDQFTTLSGELGAEWVSLGGFDLAESEDINRVQLGGDVSLCRRRLRMNMCVNAQLGSQATGVGRLQRSASIGTTFTYQASERTNYTAGINYSRTSDILSGTEASLNYFSARAAVDRDLSQSLRLGGFAQYRHRSGFANASGVIAGVELRWNWGRNNGRD